MSDLGTTKLSGELRTLAQQHPHLDEHLQRFRAEYNEFPVYTEELESEHEVRRPNVVYPTVKNDHPVFCHVFGDTGVPTKYYAVEPSLDESDSATYRRIRQRILDESVSRPAPGDIEQFQAHLDELLNEVVNVGTPRTRLGSLLSGRITVREETFDTIRYLLQRDIVGLGPLAPLMGDPENEDIHVIGPHECFTDHGTYGMLPTSIDFGSPDEFENWLRNLGERMDTPISDSNPVIDSTLPDGSRINIIYSDDVSIKGPSLTIRQFNEVPLSILQITKWGTLSPEMSAYLWLCLENDQTVFVAGETASGKTTTLNAILSFIPRDAKIYTAEDTAEVMPPHSTWQQLLTREGQGSDDSTDVDMFDLVAAALRSRPDYIIVGEVRGAEGRMAFQAAQTGHPVMLTFHASDIVSLIQRFTGDPIAVPETFMGNCDLCVFQNRVKLGDDMVRRVTSIQEIEGYSKQEGGVVTRQVFTWDPIDDDIIFTGMNNSYVLEDRIAPLLGFEDSRAIYDELLRRAEIIRRLIDSDVLEYAEVNRAIETFQNDGVEALSIDIAGLTEAGGR
ncbi:type II/IV secretion system ATPase subunit [Haloprofundus halophilus]|uniref:type II/IV secretion system ATPase subunit n=1 Tax=Haloprofundus halophilus TaxID=2283527 RepID=UPI000E439982|nr:type II/IV secretion system ATPase subunit [Haloprofundus halophilus]